MFIFVYDDDDTEKVRYCTILDVECLGRNRGNSIKLLYRNSLSSPYISVKYTNKANEKILYDGKYKL